MSQLPGYPAGVTKATVESYITSSSIARGIDPAVSIAVFRQEGLGNFRAQGFGGTLGLQEPSYGPYQLLVGGGSTGFGNGVGNEALARGGFDPRDPNTWQQNVDFALDTAAQRGWGPWSGFRKTPYAAQGNRAGIGENARPIGNYGNTVPPALAQDGWKFGDTDEGGSFYTKIENGNEVSIQYDDATGKWLKYDTATGNPITQDGKIVDINSEEGQALIGSDDHATGAAANGGPFPPPPSAQPGGAGGPPGGPAGGAGGGGGGNPCVAGAVLGTLGAVVGGGLLSGAGLGLNSALSGLTGAMGQVPGLGAISGAMQAAGNAFGAVGGAISSLSAGPLGALSALGAGSIPGLTGVIPNVLQSAAGQLLSPITSIISNPLSLPSVVQQFATAGGLQGFVGQVGANMVGNFVGGTVGNLVSNIGLASAVAGMSRNIVGGVAEGLGQSFGGAVAGGLGNIIQNMDGLITYGASTIASNLAAVGTQMLLVGNWNASNLTRMLQPSNIAAQIITRGLGETTGLLSVLAANNIPLAALDDPRNDAKVREILSSIESQQAIAAVRANFGIGVDITNLAQLADLKFMMGNVSSQMNVNSWEELGRFLVEASITEAEDFTKIGNAFLQLEDIKDLNHVIQLPAPMHKPSADLLLKTWGHGSGTFGEITLADMMSSATGHVHEQTYPVIIDSVNKLKAKSVAEPYFTNADKLKTLMDGGYVTTITGTDPETGNPTSTEVIDIPDVGQFGSLDDAVLAMVAVIEANLETIQSSTDQEVKDLVAKINLAHNTSTAQVLREAHLWNMFDFSLVEAVKMTPILAYSFAQSIPDFAQFTGHGGIADVLERLATDDFYGQSIIALMRQSRNARLLQELGVRTERFGLPVSDYYRNPLQLYQDLFTGLVPEIPMNLQSSFYQYPTTINGLSVMERDAALSQAGYRVEDLTPDQRQQTYGDYYWGDTPTNVRQQIGEQAVSTVIQRNFKVLGTKIVLIDINGTRLNIGQLTASGIANLNTDDFLAAMFILVNRVLYGRVGATKEGSIFYTDDIIYSIAEMLGEINSSNVNFLLSTRLGNNVMASFLTEISNQYLNLSTVNNTTLQRDALPRVYGGSGPAPNQNIP